MMPIPLFSAFALMTALAVMAVLWPLGRTRALRGAREADLAVYRDQLAEIGRDRASGRLPAEQAEAARIEVARRMLAADAATVVPEAGAAGGTSRRRLAAMAALVLLPLGAVGLYLHLGAPGLPGAPLAERLSAPPSPNDIAILVRRVEDHLAANPQDGRGYELLAPIYLRLGRFDDAARAYGQVIRLMGTSAERQASLGEALVAGANGVVTADAARAFAAALTLDPSDLKSTYYMGLAAEQDGRKAEAAAIWSKLVAASPPNAPWLPMVRGALARLGATPPDAASAAQPGPSAADVDAAAQLSSDDRSAMVRSMVARLEARLAENPDDLDGWLRLARSFAVLGDKDKAKDALGKARGAFAADPGALSRIDAAEKSLGLGG